jgi:hypothetical protein
MDKPPVKGIIPIDQLVGDDEEDTRLLSEMAQKAREFISSFSWCQSIREAYFGDGFGGIVAAFLFRIEPSRAEVDDWLWVIVGDTPSAYLVTDDCKTPSEALDGYIWQMSKWVKLAKRGKSSNKVIPVNAPATPEFAEMLESRLKIFRDTVLPAFKENETASS